MGNEHSSLEMCQLGSNVEFQAKYFLMMMMVYRVNIMPCTHVCMYIILWEL